MEPKKVPLMGGCHCGATRYVLFLTLPEIHNASNPPQQGDQRFSRCNCTTCHKMGLFHIKPATLSDFLLLSPLDPFETLGDYLTGDKDIHFFFCKSCGVRSFIFDGSCEVTDINPAALGLPSAANSPTKAWRPIAKDDPSEFPTYITVNGHTIDAAQGLDMRELTENKSVRYLDTYSEPRKEQPVRWERPHAEGSY